MSESLQWAIVLPTVLLVILGGVQAGVWLHARTVAEQAAAACAESAAFVGGSSTGGTASGRRVAEAGQLQNIDVALTDEPGRVRCTVTGRAVLFFDLGQSRVAGHASIVRETP